MKLSRKEIYPDDTKLRIINSDVISTLLDNVRIKVSVFYCIPVYIDIKIRSKKNEANIRDNRL